MVELNIPDIANVNQNLKISDNTGFIQYFFKISAKYKFVFFHSLS